ncbi:hypothetical protein [uncultured Intestinimonas sp.]|uniref:hypothetical protein n=1 Tax=uncultured Intestinimonas sp. TaxID=1689265 RepID=UPI0025DA91A5|nr:hypothetical protein [uncultured Intestinimonas sp.]
MRKQGVRFLTAVACLTIFLCSMVGANATVKASDYFARTQVWATRQGGGNFIVEYDIVATDIMDELGASVVFIMEEQSDGDFEVAYTFESDDMPELIESNAYTTYGCIPYEGTPGTRYYATFGLYAKNSSGNETIYFDTNIITA